MEPIRVLENFVDCINRRFASVYSSVTKYCDTGFGLMPSKQDPEVYEIGDYNKLYEHKYYETKPYQCESCAAYKLIKYLERETVGFCEEIYWRFEPEIVSTKEWDGRVLFKGRARLSVF
jgi:hypothetical protein